MSDEKLGKLEQEAKDLTSKLEVASAEVHALRIVFSLVYFMLFMLFMLLGVRET